MVNILLAVGFVLFMLAVVVIFCALAFSLYVMTLDKLYDLEEKRRKRG